MKLIYLSVSDAENKKFYEIAIHPNDVRSIQCRDNQVYFFVRDVKDQFTMNFMSGDAEKDRVAAQKYFAEFQKQWESQL